MNIAIIVAAGKGERMNHGFNKVFLKLGKSNIISSTVSRFESCKLVDLIIVVTAENDIQKMRETLADFKKIAAVVPGGRERQDSVFSGITKALELGSETDIVLIHNGCNPFVSLDEVEQSIKEAVKYDAAVCAFPLKDTIKRVKNGFVFETIPRNNVWQMQTPQAMKLGVAKVAFDKAYADGHYATDDVALVERIGKKVKIVECSYKNFKITTPDDYEIAQGFTGTVGIGKDSHLFCANKQLVLGGAEIDYSKGLEAVSDGDVVLHSLFNAISGALGQRSIGHYFPTKDPKNKDRSSKEFFEVIEKLLNERNYSVNNVSISIEAKEPRLEGYVDEMKKEIAELLNINKEQIGITLTTGEGLTAFGRGEGIEAISYVSLRKND
ncbi:2-C-methyl-D-erythritol 4-phosphate cytidylyltransferase [Candidatus Woesearchaeota archaeon]|nr:2-C-methyl-D-erythritol 4-phosphate cytidylyltransferase [Candidatus Woesearchaeota archaeon]